MTNAESDYAWALFLLVNNNVRICINDHRQLHRSVEVYLQQGADGDDIATSLWQELRDHDQVVEVYAAVYDEFVCEYGGTVALAAKRAYEKALKIMNVGGQRLPPSDRSFTDQIDELAKLCDHAVYVEINDFHNGDDKNAVEFFKTLEGYRPHAFKPDEVDGFIEIAPETRAEMEKLDRVIDIQAYVLSSVGFTPGWGAHYGPLLDSMIESAKNTRAEYERQVAEAQNETS